MGEDGSLLKAALQKGWVGGTSGAAAMTVQVTRGLIVISDQRDQQ